MTMTTKKQMKLDNLMKTLHAVVEDNTMDPHYQITVERMRSRGLHVYHVIDSLYILGGSDRVHMVSYLYISEADDLNRVTSFLKDFRDGYGYANVVNSTWGIEELGEIRFEVAHKRLIRTA